MARRHEPVSPFAPPKPDEADLAKDTAEEPMAVARDAQHTDESFSPTTAMSDQWAADVHHKWRDPNMRKEQEK